MDLKGKRIILGSGSPRRRELLEGLCIDFEVDTGNNFEESFAPDTPHPLIPALMSQGKSHLFHRPLLPNEILITADTMVLLDSRIMGKPHSREEAAAMLSALSGRDHEVITAVTIRSPAREVTFEDSTIVTFNSLSPEEIDFYIERFRPFDKAGAYGIQEWIGLALIRGIRGSFYNVMGLPVDKVYSHLLSFLNDNQSTNDNTTMDDKLIRIASLFDIEGPVASVKPLGEGFINDTLTVTLEGRDTPSYILQRKNHHVFPNVPAMMDNIDKVTRHIKSKVHDPLRQTLTVVPTKDGALYYKDEDGNFWAMCLFIAGTMTYQRADSPETAYQGGLGLGQFHHLVSDFKEPLAVVIEGFHDLGFRFRQWDEAVKRDAAGRVKDLAEEISWIESRREKMMDFWSKVESGEIPRRVTHGDTKISNFLFNEDDASLLCAIDLDTMMTSTLLSDTGDALRSYTNTGEEDDRDLSKVSMGMPMFQAYMEGYLSMMKGSLTESELKYLAFSGIYITFEQVLRFLMDYIDGDTYYKTKYPGHNLVRTRAQYKLLQSMEEQLPEMEAMICKLLPLV